MGITSGGCQMEFGLHGTVTFRPARMVRPSSSGTPALHPVRTGATHNLAGGGKTAITRKIPGVFPMQKQTLTMSDAVHTAKMLSEALP